MPLLWANNILFDDFPNKTYCSSGFFGCMLKTVCSDVEVEPLLQELEGEQFTTSSALTGDQARPDIRARGFYRPGQVAFFDVKVINPNSTSYLQHSTKKTLENAERQKTRCYNEKILNLALH